MSDEGAQIIQFPRKPVPAANTVYSYGQGVPAPGQVYARCEGIYHIFERPTGRCQCGSEVWVEIAP